MALFPKIDQPCPLGVDEQKRIAGYCGRCSKTVHALDAMSDAERVALLQSARDSLCVSYRTRRTPGVGLSAALALSMAAPAFGAEVSLLAIDHAVQQQSIDEPPPSLLTAQRPGPKCAEAGESVAGIAAVAQAPAALPNFVTITVGGVTRPEDAEWIDDSALPDLPVTVNTATD